jgi:hypothetical protein
MANVALKSKSKSKRIPRLAGFLTKKSAQASKYSRKSLEEVN